ncbi:hypothetical protein Daus18300_001346 [Diaporthe australafricana]|uniref:L-dopachrome isomerase n=1 Tax=Diaporthe australafricana TaxID=127596 RepID=A0ABR3XYN0_9PEZI
MSLPERPVVANRHPWTLPQLAEIDELMQPITRRPPGDMSKPTALTMGRAELSRRKNHHYEEAPSGRCIMDTLRERIQSDSMVVAELKTNVIIGDEFIFITELSAKIAERYQRPLSSIAVQVQHSACVFFAGTFEPAYILTLSALAPYIRTSTNQRNAYLLSMHLEEALGVPPPRGLIRFAAMLNENVALNGKTLVYTLEEEAIGGGAMGVIDEEQPATFARRKRLSIKSLSNIKTSPLAGEITPPTSAEEMPAADEKPEKVKVAKRRKSFVAGLFGRPGTKKENERQLPEVPVPRVSV